MHLANGLPGMLLGQLECNLAETFPLGGELAEPLTEFLHGLVTALSSVSFPGLGDGTLSTVQGTLIHLLGYPEIQLLGWSCFSRWAVLPQVIAGRSWSNWQKLAGRHVGSATLEPPDSRGADSTKGNLNSKGMGVRYTLPNQLNLSPSDLDSAFLIHRPLHVIMND